MPGLPTAGPHTGTTLDNGLVRITLDPDRGTILSLQLHGSNRDLVPSGQAMDDYLYVPGRDPSTVVTGGQAVVRITDAGPVVWTAVVAREAPGTESGLETTVRLFAGSERVEIVHRFDKTMTCDPEAVLFRFPIDLDRAETMVGGAWGAWRAELDQPPGANRNYATVERWVDMHDGAGGLQIVSVDVPGIQLGSLGTDATVAGWRNRVDPEPVLYSYVMNNYWETNYRAGQDGPHELACTLRPHSGFDEAVSERFALETAQPLVVRRPPENVSAAAPLEVAADTSVVSLVRALGNGEGFLLRLYNPSNDSDVVRIAGPSGADLASLQRTDPWGEPLPGGHEVTGDVALEPHEVATFRVRP
jgi:alpha-mannosidase